MPSIKVLFAGTTYSIGFATGKREILEYAIVNERDSDQIDVVILTKVPGAGRVKFADIENGWSERPEWELRDRILILSGVPRRSQLQAIVRLERVRVEKEIPAGKVVEAVLAKAKEIEKGGGDNTVEVDGLKFSVVRFKPCSTEEEVEALMTNLYHKVTGGRKRVFFAAPAFVEILGENGSGWYVATIPKVVHFARDNPTALLVGGVIDEGGFGAPFIVIKGMTVQDLGTAELHVRNVEWLVSKVNQYGVAGALFGGGAGEEESPI